MQLLALAALVLATSPMDVPDPRPASCFVDMTGTLQDTDLVELQHVCERAAKSGELFVAIVRSTDGANPRQWTTALFNRLRLDTKERNRGVVLMAALDDRKAEIVVGDGYPAGIESETDRIMQNDVVRWFKAGDPRRAIVEGAKALETHVIAAGAPAQAPAPPAVLAAASHPAVLAVPDPRASGGVVDLAGRLSPLEREHALTGVREASTSSELAVVILKDTADLDARVFALGLAQRLKLDDGPRQRGILLLVAGDAGPRVELVLGDGFDPTFRSDDGLVAHLRSEGATGTAIAAVARELAHLGPAAEQLAVQRRLEDTEPRVAERYVPDMPDEEANALDTDNPVVWAGGVGGVLAGGLGVREVLRRRPRSCRKCKVRMQRLGEAEDDKHLKAGELAEERLRSVDYDIWACPQCGEVLKTRWGAIFSSYSRCGSCSWRTMSSTSRTITAATTSSTGLAEVTEDCQHCSHHRTYTRVIPRVQQSSSSSSGRSGGGGFSSGRGSSGSW